MDWREVFNVYEEVVNDNLTISVFELEKLTKDIHEYLNNHLVSICEGKKSDTEISIVKKRIIELFSGKHKTWIMGAIAEFFIHLYMNLAGYSQECMFFNLEENSIKKGFDGYYSMKDKQWIMESKSGSILTKNISHINKLNEAIIDLEEKFEGKAKNNPWRNAYNHACHCDVGAPKSIRKSIKNLSDDYTKSKFHKLKEFNIVPCATLFLETDWNPKNKNLLIAEVQEAIEHNNYKKAHIICVTHGSIDIFNTYINS